MTILVWWVGYLYCSASAVIGGYWFLSINATMATKSDLTSLKPPEPLAGVLTPEQRRALWKNKGVDGNQKPIEIFTYGGGGICDSPKKIYLIEHPADFPYSNGRPVLLDHFPRLPPC